MRVILDTNLWSYIGECDEHRALNQLVGHRQLKVIVPPSMLLEVLRTPKPEIRQRIVAAMTARGFEHPLPEARTESDEVTGLVRRHRPEWLRRWPKPDRLPMLEAFWTRRLWQIARDDPDRLNIVHPVEEAKRLALIRNEQQQRAAVRKAGFQPTLLRGLRIDMSRVTEEDRAGWEGGPLEAWRVEIGGFYWEVLVRLPARVWLSREDATHLDWIDPWVSTERLASDRGSYNRLWYVEATREEIPRNWIRWAVRWIQRTTKVTPGNPADEQHATYLIDCDVFLSSDGRFVRVAEAVRKEAPVRMARSGVVDGSKGSIVEAIDRAIERIENGGG